MRRPVNAVPPGRLMWTTAEVAEVLGWRVKRTRNWLLRYGSARKCGRHYYTSQLGVRRAFPDVADDVIATLLERAA